MRSPLVIAGVLALSFCSCKRETREPGQATGREAPANKASDRDPSNDLSPSGDSSTSGKIRKSYRSGGYIRIAENAYKEYDEQQSALDSAKQNETLIATLNAPDALVAAIQKTAEASALLMEKEREWTAALANVNAVQSKDPDDDLVNRYLAFVQQRSLISTKEKERAALPGETEEFVIQELDVELEAGYKKLGELRAAWQEIMPKK